MPDDLDRPVVAGDPVRIGVLGCSGIAWRRALAALSACPLTSIQVVASRDRAKAERFAARFGGVPATYEELLTRDDVDAVYLPLPPALHLPWGAKVLRAGKHLLLEKPAATCAADARELVRLAGEQGLVLRENFTFRYHSQHEFVRRLMASGRLGAVRSIAAQFCFPALPDDDIRYAADLGGGSLLDAGVYPIRLAQLLLGNDLTVAGASLRENSTRGVDVSGQALLVSGTGVPVSVHFGFEHSYGSSYSVWGSAAQMHLDRAFTPPPGRQPVVRIDEQDHAEEHVLPAYDQFAGSIESFAEAVLAGRTARADDLEDTVRTAELVDEIRLRAVRVAVSAEPR